VRAYVYAISETGRTEGLPDTAVYISCELLDFLTVSRQLRLCSEKPGRKLTFSMAGRLAPYIIPCGGERTTTMPLLIAQWCYGHYTFTLRFVSLGGYLSIPSAGDTFPLTERIAFGSSCVSMLIASFVYKDATPLYVALLTP